MVRPYLLFWGKARGERAGEPCSHPLAYHCLDVAACADALLRHNERKALAISNRLRTTPGNARSLLVGLIAFHDIGKFVPAFQAKNAQAWPASILGDWRAMAGGRHDADGFAMGEAFGLCEAIAPALDEWIPSDVESLWGAIAGHHGKPVAQIRSDLSTLTATSRDAAKNFRHDIAALFSPIEQVPQPDPRDLAIVSWALAGLTVLADWIGSNRDWFPYRNPDLNLVDYWSVAQAAATAAIAKSGVLPAAPAKSTGASRLFPNIETLSPLQNAAANLSNPDGPILAIIEDVTGAGKTEAALLISSKITAAGRADGLHIALPTMATANAMYDRLAGVFRRFFVPDSAPSLVLAHGKSRLHEGFMESILDHAGTDADDQNDAEKAGDEGSAACAAWIADDRRKAFLAQVGVGTIDQALLGVLPTRHQSLRLWGLSDRVLIIDEAHAYDAYMAREIETLLEFQSALGGSAIVLSATLARAQRQALVGAFVKGLGARPHKTQTSDAYPLLTLVSSARESVLPIETRADRRRSLSVRRIGAADEALDYIESTAALGAAVAWIRNAVDDAIEAAEALRDRGLSVVLLHARYAMGDRLDIEARVRNSLGLSGSDFERHGFILVGTQILEQSLDYDVDAMVVDLAPIDLVIQRAGRLWRHASRKDRPLLAPELLVLSPDPDSVADEKWYRQISRRGASVYAHHGVVWRSAKALFEAGKIDTPDGVRALVESVYASSDFTDIPKPLLRQSNKAEGQRKALRSIAGANLLQCADAYGECSNIWTKETIAQTRLGEPTIVFRLGKLIAGRIAPYYNDAALQHDVRRAWTLSEVSIAARRATNVVMADQQRQTLVEEAKAAWPDWERDLPLLVLASDGEAWRGVVLNPKGEKKTISYRVDQGLCFVEG